MKRNIFYTLLVLLLPIVGLSQLKQLNYIDNTALTGVYQIGNDVASLSFVDYRKIDDKDLYQVSFLSDKQERIQLEIMHGARFIEVAVVDDAAYFLFDSPQLGSYEIVKIRNKQLETTTTHFIEEENFRPGGVRQIVSNSAGKIFVFRDYQIVEQVGRETKVTESGTEITVFDANLNSNTNGRFSGNGRPVSVFTIAEGLVMAFQVKNMEEKKYDLNLLIIDNELKELGQYNLTENGSFFPSEIISYEGDIVMAGYNLKSTIFDSKATEGLFVRVIGLDGTVKNESTYSWDELKALLKDKARGDFVFNGKQVALVHHIIPSDKGFKIICESYSNNSGVTAAEVVLRESGDKRNVVAVKDFIVLETNAVGAISTVQIFEKDPVNIEVAASRKIRGLRLENLLKKYKGMPFKSYKDDKIVYVSYQNQAGVLCEMNLTNGAITEIAKIELAAPNEQELSNFEAKLQAAGQKLEYGIEKIDYVFTPFSKSDLGYFVLDNNQVLIYLLSPETFSVYYSVVG